MANALVVLDRDPSRRATSIARARNTVAPVPGLEISELVGEGWSALWAAHPKAPVSTASDGSGGTFLWGDAIATSGHRLNASEIRQAWRDEELANWDGFHLAIEATNSGDLTASTDILGLFPCYYWNSGDVTLVGTSVDLFRAHPQFRAELDPSGMIGIMLLNGQVGGRTLWKGVRRLGVRRQLRLRDGRFSEVENLPMPETRRDLLGLPIEGHVELLATTLANSAKRMTQPGEPHGILLSGGIDSRQIGGFLVDEGIPMSALTFGLDTDIEMRCARKVAKRLGMPHFTAEIQPEDYPGAADLLAKAEGLAAGFCNVLEWGMIPHLDSLPPRITLGHAFDGMIGGIHIAWALDPAKGSLEFDTVFRRFNRWGFSAESLRELLDPRFHPEIEAVVADIRDIYESSSSEPNLKAWHFDMLTRQRFHVGSAVWPMTFRGWPTSPVFDREVLFAAASMPSSSISGRRLQMELLIARHPELAKISLDRNSFDSLPLVPTLGDYLRVGAGNKWRRILQRLPFQEWKRENRFYYRTYDFHSPGWLNIRKSAEAHRKDLPGILRREVVDRLLPRPDQPLGTQDGIIDSSNAKMLVGLALAGHRNGF